MNNELIAYYINLLTLQYRDKAKAKATIAAFTDIIMIYDLMRKVEAGYDLETAIGVQLDIIGKYVGVDRVITGAPFDRVYFGSVDYATPTPYVDIVGSIDYAEPDPPDAQIYTYESDQQPAYFLNDQELREIIKIKIGLNSSNHSPGSIDKVVQDFFGNKAIFNDEKNMTIGYIFDVSAKRLVEIAVSEGFLPKPMAVKLDVSFVPDIENIFGSVGYNATSVPDFLAGSIDYSQDAYGSSLDY